MIDPYDQPLSAWDSTWKELAGARAFMESSPFHEMQPRNDLVTAGDAFCLAKPGTAYALYLAHGGSVTIELPGSTTYKAAWWNPSNDKDRGFQSQKQVPGGQHKFKAPDDGDWALRIVRAE